MTQPTPEIHDSYIDMPLWGTLCPATYHPVEWKPFPKTHTCERMTGHDGLHICPGCGTRWSDQ